MLNKFIRHSAFIALTVAFLSSCSWFQDSPVPEQPQSAEPPAQGAVVPEEPLPVEPKPKTEAALELIWKIPEEPVDEYVIRYGQDPLALKSEHRIKSSDVKSINDSRHGDVYQYILEDVPESASIFVAISAIKNGVESPPSQIFKVGQTRPR